MKGRPDRGASSDRRQRKAFQRPTTAQYRKRTTVSAAYTVQPSDDVILVDTTDPVTITLPPLASSFERVLTVKDSIGDGAATNDLTIDANSTETIDGATTYVIDADREAVTIIAASDEWKVISRYVP